MKTKLSKIIIVLVALVTIPSIVILGRTNDFVSDEERVQIKLVDESSNENGVSIKEKNIDADNWAKLVYTPYENIDTLSNDKITDIEAAYKSIVDAANVSALNQGIEGLAIKANTTIDDLLIRDVFDLSYYCSNGFESKHSGEYNELMNINLDVGQMKNFVCLLHYVNGEWKIVTGASVVGTNNSVLSFHANSLSPFAIVIKRSDVYDAVDTGTR